MCASAFEIIFPLLPKKVNLPCDGIIPKIAFIKVDLPEPFGPIRTLIVLDSSEKFMLEIAGLEVLGYLTLTPSALKDSCDEVFFCIMGVIVFYTYSSDFGYSIYSTIFELTRLARFSILNK